jgi:hypothetical protein
MIDLAGTPPYSFGKSSPSYGIVAYEGDQILT